MSASQFLRGHGWRMRGGGYEHPRLPDVVNDPEVALLQQARWLELGAHEGGFTCADAERGARLMASAVSRLRDERDAALRAYDAEVIGRRDEVTRLHGEIDELNAAVEYLREKTRAQRQ